MLNPQKFEFERLLACLKCPEVGAPDNGSYQGWLVNRAVDGAEPDWGAATMRCLLLLGTLMKRVIVFSLLVNVFSVIVKTYDAK